jgi:hypothetical protein
VRSLGGATSGSGVRRHAGDGRSTLLPMVSSGRRDPPNGVALEDLSIGSTEDLISDGRGERTAPSPVTQTALRSHWHRSRTARVDLLCPPLRKVAAEIADATGFACKTTHYPLPRSRA